MGSTCIISFDPGVSSGIAFGSYDVDRPYTLHKAWQFSGGLSGLLEWCNGITRSHTGWWHHDQWLGVEPVTISEKFTPLQNKGFSLTMDSAEPLRCEGALVALGLMPDYSASEARWQRPNQMYRYGGKSLVEKKRLAHLFLKENNMYVTGKTVGCPDANDARSAILHGVAYAAKSNKPTFDMIADWSRQNEGL